LEGIKRR